MNPFYASAGPRRLHIIDPQNRDVMLCSAKLAVHTTEFTITETGKRRDNGIRHFPVCKRCQKKADKAGLVENQPTTTPTPHVVEPPREDQFVTVAAEGGKVHHAFADDDTMIPLCRESRGIRQYTLWHRTNAPLSCSRCIGYEQGRAAARAKYNATIEPGPLGALKDGLCDEDEDVPALHELFNDNDPYPAWAKPSMPTPKRKDDQTQPTVRVGTFSDSPELATVADLLTRHGYKPVTLKANPNITIRGYGYFIAPAWDGKLRVALLTDDPTMHGRDLLPKTWEAILTGAGYRINERHPNALIITPPTPPVAEVRVISHQNTTYGTLAEHTNDSTTRAILATLEDDADLEAAEITGDAITADTVNGVVAIPRPERGAVYVHWFTNGAGHTTTEKRRPAELAQIHRILSGAGYRVAAPERGSLVVKVLLPTTTPGTGVEPRNTDHTAVNAAAATLGASGLPLAHLTADHDNQTTPGANGYVVTDHNPETVWVLHLVDGSTRDPHTGQYPRHQLARAAQTLSDQGWAVQNPDEWTWRLWARRPDPVVHYRRNLAEHGAVCGAAALSADDAGMSTTPGAATCPTCRAHLDTRPPLPRRTHNADRIGQAGRRWLTPRPRVSYHRSLGWSIDGRLFPDMRDAVNHLVSQGQPRPAAFATIGREQMIVMSQDLPDGVTLYEDDHLGGYGYACTRSLCTKRGGGFDYPGGAMYSAHAHLMNSHT